MMKTKNWMRTAIFAVLAAAATACTDNDLIDKDVNNTPDITDGKMTIYAASGDEAADTRVAYQDASGILTWQKEDYLTVALMIDGKVQAKETDFLFNGKDGERSGSFTGTAIEMIEGGTWSIYYPNRVEVDNNGIATLSMMGQTQKEDDNTEHLRNYILLGTPDQGISNLNDGCKLEMKSSIMKFVLEKVPSEVDKLTNLVWMVETDNGTRSITLGFTPGAVKFDGTNTSLTAYLSFMPQDMKPKTDGKFTVILTGDKTYVAEGKVNASYEAGKRYTAKIGEGIMEWKEKAIMALTVKVSANMGFSIPFPQSGNVPANLNLTVDWGDGKATEVASGTALAANDDFNHTYSEAGTYTIIITSDQTDETKQQIPDFNFNNRYYYGINGAKLISIDTPLLNTKATSFSYCFNMCSALQSIPQGLFDKNTKAIDYSYCFFQCSALQSIPSGLFDKNTAATDFSDCFNYCSALQSIPSGLFDNNTAATDFSFCFSDCSSLQSIPSGLFDKNIQVTTFRNCFYGCTTLQSIPSGLFNNNTQVTSFYACFRGCSALEKIPSGLFNNNTQVTTFGGCFYGCTALKEIPQGLFDNNTVVSNFASCFENCSALQSIPQGLFNNNKQVENFNFCFSGCTHLALNQKIFSTTEDKSRFSGQEMYFASCFRNVGSALDSGKGGTAPDLWKYDGADTWTNIYNCFAGATNLSNYKDIYKSWGGPLDKSGATP